MQFHIIAFADLSYYQWKLPMNVLDLPFSLIAPKRPQKSQKKLKRNAEKKKNKPKQYLKFPISIESAKIEAVSP